MANYEATFITRQDMSDREVEKFTEQLSEKIKENGGKVVKQEYWGLRSLAYRINKNRKGHYMYLGVDGSPEVINELRRTLALSEDVMRNLIIRVEGFSKEPTPIIQASGDE